MAKLLVAGGFESASPATKDVAEFSRIIGAEIIRQGHVLLNSCRTELDRLVVDGAYEQIQKEGGNARERLISYVMKGQAPVHSLGTVRESRLEDWELGNPGLTVPEPLDLADAVILIGGFHGTHRAANWARIRVKPLLPVARFGGAARVIYHQELDRFDRVYRSKLEKSDYENLSDVTSDLPHLADTVVRLAERLRTSKDVFVIMSFAGDPSLVDAYDTFKAACEALQYRCKRVDDDSPVPRILPEILNQISCCAFAIVDLSHQRPNVYYELGYAEGLGKPVIVTARRGTELPFDVKDIPVIFWDNQKGLREQLTRKMQVIASTQGR